VPWPMRRASICALCLIFVIAAVSSPGISEQVLWKQQVLENGLKVFAAKTESSNGRVALALKYRTGARSDPSGLDGLAHLLEHLTFYGISTVGPCGADKIASSCFGTVGGTVSWDCTVFHWELSSATLPRALEFEKARMAVPVFTDDDLQRERRVILSETSESKEGVDSLAGRAFSAILGGDIRPIGGSPATLSAISVDDLKRFHERNYRPGNAEIYIAGDMETGEMMKLVAKVFSSLPGKPIPQVPSVASPTGNPLLCVTDGGGLLVVPLSADPAQARQIALQLESLLTISGSPVVREMIIERREISDLSVDTAVIGGYCYALVRFSCSDLAETMWGRLLACIRKHAEDPILKECGIAASKLAIADARREELAPWSLVRNAAMSASCDWRAAWLKAAGSELTVDPVAAVALVNSTFDLVHVAGPEPVASGGFHLGRGKGDEAGKEDYVEYKKRAFDRCRSVFVSDEPELGLSAFSVAFRGPGGLNLFDAIAASRVRFHAAAKSSLTSFELEKLGWRWDIGPYVWSFWGISGNLPSALRLVLAKLRITYEPLEEARFQIGLLAAGRDFQEAAARALFGRDEQEAQYWTAVNSISYRLTDCGLFIRAAGKESNFDAVLLSLLGEERSVVKDIRVKVPALEKYPEPSVLSASAKSIWVAFMGPPLGDKAYPLFWKWSREMGANSCLDGRLVSLARDFGAYTADCRLLFSASHPWLVFHCGGFAFDADRFRLQLTGVLAKFDWRAMPLPKDENSDEIDTYRQRQSSRPFGDDVPAEWAAGLDCNTAAGR